MLHISLVYTIYMYTQYSGWGAWVGVQYIYNVHQRVCACVLPHFQAFPRPRYAVLLRALIVRACRGGGGNTESSDITIRTINACSVTGSTGKAWNRKLHVHACACVSALYFGCMKGCFAMTAC